MARPSPLAPLLAAALTVLVLGWAASLHGLHFVDLVAFSRRARELTAGRGPTDGLYPFGLPAWLAFAHSAGVALLPAARALSVAAAALLAATSARRLGLPAAVWLLAQAPFLTWGSSEGTDMVAAGLSIAAVFCADRPRLAGLLVGLALSFRWTAAAWLPALALALPAGGRLPALGGFVVGVLPHVLGCAFTGTLVLPDQSLNLTIAAGPGAPPPAGPAGIFARMPRGLAEAAPFLVPDIASRLGAALLLATALLPSRTAAGSALRRLAGALLGGGVLHAVGLAAVFANPRLALPTTLVALAGVGVAAGRIGEAAPRWQRAVGGGLLLLAAGTAATTLPALRAPPKGAEFVTALRGALAGCPELAGPALANNALVHTEVGGWLVPAVQLSGLRVTPRTTPAALGRIADEAGLRVLVLDPVRARGQPGLNPLSSGTDEEVDGWRRCTDRPLRIWTR